jgi:glycosyltransferase involved in cell wall biosynthesis
MRIAFYSPIKPPDHPVPSGDRQVARLIIRALEKTGHHVEIASRLRSYRENAESDALIRLQAEAALDAAQLVEHFATDARRRPQAWLTYHAYYRSPDLIGPEVCRRLGLPLLTVEAAYAGKRDRDAWAPWQARVADLLGLSRLNFCLTARDREGIEPLARQGSIVCLPPFIDLADLGEAAGPSATRTRTLPVQLLAVAMMRERAKLASYRMLAEVLAGMTDLPWDLTIVGDGPARDAVERLFAGLPRHRVQFAGARDHRGVAQAYAKGDVLVWPGVDEAYGLVYLEAQACGLPVVAQRTAGVPEVVNDGEGGFLTQPGNTDAMRAALALLIERPDLHRQMGQSARDFVLRKHILPHAASVLDNALQSLEGYNNCSLT